MIDFMDRYGRSFEELAKRIGRMLFDRDDVVYFFEDEDKYQIGNGNNYWLYRRSDGGFRLSVRYMSQECRTALEYMLKHYMNVQICEPE